MREHVEIATRPNPSARLSADTIARLYRQARADRWSVSIDAFGAALETSVSHAFAGRSASDRDVDRYLASLHADDLALACACASGSDAAWDHFVREYRPVLYRAADALDPSGGARELADALYADLFGLPNRDGERQSLFRYFHGRSSLATWLRAVLSQRHVDRVRVVRRMDPLPDVDPPAAGPAPDPDRARFLTLIARVLAAAIAALPDRDRLRLACYYHQELPLAKTGRVLGESEATASRQLARTRRALRAEVERRLGDDEGLNADQIARCFECAVEDPGALDLSRMVDNSAERKESRADRSV